MIDDVHSTSASSVISNSVRDQILGKPTRRTKTKPTFSTAQKKSHSEYHKPKPTFGTPLTKKPSPEYHTPVQEPFFDAPEKTRSASLIGHTSDLSMNSFVLVSHTDITNSPNDDSRRSLQPGQSRPEQVNLLERTDKASNSKIIEAKVPTQTVAIQTSESRHASSSRSERRAQADKEVSVPEDTTSTATSCQTLDSGCACPHCCPCDSSDSDDSYSTDFLDLPYQNDEKYLKLLRELEKKLLARNRARVRKTMLEFEKRSRLNQNLEGPVFDDDACLLRRLGPPNVCSKCGRRKKVSAVNSDIMQNEKSWDEGVESAAKRSDPSVGQVERCLHKSHWRLDPRSGEWIKVSCFQQTDFARQHGDGLKDERNSFATAVTAGKGCQCRQKKRR